MIAKTASRVACQTAEEVNEQIRRRTEMNVAYFAHHPEEIAQRLDELDEEWDIERTLETMASGVSLAGLMLGIARNRRYLIVPLVVQGFMMMHAIQGWCPPLPLLRRLGARTEREIDAERYALKALRGDFENLPPSTESRGTPPALQAVQR